MRTTTTAATALAAVGLLALAACGSDDNSGSASGATTGASADCAKGSVTGAGSTFQQNLQQQWIKDYTAKCSGAQINYQGVGSGAGIQQFGSGTVNFGGTDVVMKDDEQATADKTCGSTAIHILVGAGGVAVEYNLSGVDKLNLSAPTLAGIYNGTIKTWDAAQVKADNPGVSLPSKAIVVVHRSDGSGTTAVFTSFLAANAPGVWKAGAAKDIQWPTGQGAKGSDGVSATVKQTQGAIGYAEVSFAQANSIGMAMVKGAGSSFVSPTADNVTAALQSFKVTGTGNNMAGTVDYTTTSGYPISTVTYVIACQKPKDSAQATLMSKYFQYAVGPGQEAATGLGFAPLPSSLADQAKTAAASLVASS